MREKKLWLLKRIAETPIYDVANGFVVRAETEADARALAAGQAGDEGAKTWTSATSSTCVPLWQAGPQEIVMMDFNAG